MRGQVPVPCWRGNVDLVDFRSFEWEVGGVDIEDCDSGWDF